jgi:SAM domain (Sterile alpha motif)
VPQILDWLKELNLEQYGDRFVENGIDTSVLRDLTDQDSKSSASYSGIGGRCCAR